MARRNESPNPSAAVDLAGWLGAGTHTRVAGQSGPPRSTAAEVALPASAYGASIGCAAAPAETGQTWSAVGWVWSSVAYTVRCNFVGWDGTNFVTALATAVDVPLQANTWTEVRLPPAALSGTGTWTTVNFQCDFPTVGSGTFRLSSCRIEQVDDDAITYADGDSTDWTWDGTAGASTSTGPDGTGDPDPDPPATGQVGVSGRTFTRGGGRWFWLGDTAWAVFRRSESDIETYLDARVAQGFNLIQAVMMFPQAGGPTNVYGIAPYSGGSISNRNDSYWNHVDFFVQACASRGLIAALHPLWADGQQGSVVTSGNAYAYGQFLGNRYKDADNITWTFGGDYPPTGYTTLWSNLADGIRSTGDTHLITYHPQGDQTSEQFFDGASWIDFHMMQGGHCRNYSVDRGLVTDTYGNTGGKPWLDGEPIYEQHPYCWIPANGYATALDCRRDAYWRVLGGAAGHTYGHHSVWQFFTGSGGTSDPIDTWQTALSAEAANDMQWVRKLFESRPRLEPANNRVSNPGTDAGWTPAAEDAAGTTLIVYSANGASRTVSKSGISGSQARPWWYNPRTGETTQLSDTAASGTQSFTPPSNNTDWVLVLDSVDAGYAAPGTTVYEDIGGEPTEPGPQPGDILGTEAALSWTPTVAGVYVLRYTATNAAGSDSDDITVTVVPAVIEIDVRNARSLTRATRPQLTQHSTLLVKGARSASHAQDALLAQRTSLTVHGARSASRSTRPTLTQTTELIIRGARALTRASRALLGQSTPLGVADARATATASRPLLTQTHDLTVHGARAQSAATGPRLTQSTALVVRSARAQTGAQAPLLAQTQALAVSGARAATSASTALLAQVHVLLVTGARSATEAQAPRLTQRTPLGPIADARSVSTATRPLLGAALIVRGARSQTAATRPALTQTHTLVVRAARAATAAARALLAQRSTVAVRDARADTGAERVLLGQRTPLTVRDARAHTGASTALLGQSSALTVHGADAATTATRPALTQRHGLLVRAARALTTVTRPLVTTSGVLIVRPARALAHGTRPLLTQDSPLVVSGARSGTEAGRVLVTQRTALVVRDARAQSRATRPLVTAPDVLVVHGARAATHASPALLAQTTPLLVRDARAATRAGRVLLGLNPAEPVGTPTRVAHTERQGLAIDDLRRGRVEVEPRTGVVEADVQIGQVLPDEAFGTVLDMT